MARSDYRSDLRSTEELVRVALSEEDEDVAWRAVTTLHFRGTREVFEAARQLCESVEPKERRVGADILGQLGPDPPNRPFLEESVPLMLAMLEREEDPDVLGALAVALGHLHDPRAIEPLSRLKGHPDENVRYGVVHGLLAHEGNLAVDTLIELSRDEDFDVRNWATFGLGSQIDADTEEIRAALLERLSEEDGEVRGEALVGLAKRHDERVLEPLMRELSSDEVWELAVEAAEELGDPRLLPALRALQEWWDASPSTLENAIAACSGSAGE